jgi:hypothetical protein
MNPLEQPCSDKTIPSVPMRIFGIRPLSWSNLQPHHLVGDISICSSRGTFQSGPHPGTGKGGSGPRLVVERVGLNHCVSTLRSDQMSGQITILLPASDVRVKIRNGWLSYPSQTTLWDSPFRSHQEQRSSGLLAGSQPLGRHTGTRRSEMELFREVEVTCSPALMHLSDRNSPPNNLGFKCLCSDEYPFGDTHNQTSTCSRHSTLDDSGPRSDWKGREWTTLGGKQAD